MENENRSFLARLNPANLKFTFKILLLVLLVVIAVLVTYFSIGLRTLHHSLIRSAGEQLEEISFTKAAEVELSFARIREQIYEIARKEIVHQAGTELIKGFRDLEDDHYELFTEDKQKEISLAMEKYYKEVVAEHLPLSGDQIGKYLPGDKRSLTGQYLFIEQNPKAYGEKQQYSGGNDFAAYSGAHASYHPPFLELLRKLNANDLYIIDPESGYVVYSAKKNIDFGTNLYTGAYRNSPLARSYLQALAADLETVQMTDFYHYSPAGDLPACFVSLPVYFFNQLVCVLVVQYNVSLLDDILYDVTLAGGVDGLEYNVVGENLLLRSNPGQFLEDPVLFDKVLRRKTAREDRELIDKHTRSGSFAFFLQYPHEYKQMLLKERVFRMEDYFGKKVIASSHKLELGGPDLYLVAQINKADLLSSFNRQVWIYTVLTLALMIILFLVIRRFGNTFSSRLESLRQAMLLLQSGEKSTKISRGADDEVGTTIDAFNQLSKRINNAEEFAIEMSEGNYNYEFKILSERDSLGKSLNVLKDKLIQSKEEYEARAREDEIQNWINSGVAKFNDLLRENNDNIGKLAYTLIENLVGYLDAQVGGIFLIEDENGGSKTIELVASYAYDRRKYIKKKQPAEEGLLGACYLEKKPIYLKEIPEDYIEIVSGLGHELPKCLYLVPLKVDENVLGIIEVGSFKEFSKHHIDFIDRVSDSIAATFISVRLNMKTVSLLEESNSRAEEITQQEEEMRQNLEEMQATQEELARLRQDDEKRTHEMQLIVDNTRVTLKNMLEEIPGGYSLKDQNGIIHLINSEGAAYYGLSIDRVTGRADHELLAAKIYENEHQKDLLTLEEGEQQYAESIEVKGKTIKYQVTKKPFMMSEIGQQGILTLRYRQK